MSQHLQDQFEIQQLLYRYADATDRRDAQAFEACFLDGQVIIQGPGWDMRDSHEIIGRLAEDFDWTMHNVHNHLHQIEGDSATGFTYCVASHVSNRNGRRTRLDWYIRYQDELRRGAQGWVFVSRQLQVGCQEEVLLAN